MLLHCGDDVIEACIFADGHDRHSHAILDGVPDRVHPLRDNPTDDVAIGDDADHAVVDVNNPEFRRNRSAPSTSPPRPALYSDRSIPPIT
jgi:hypothetical protein